MKGKALHDYLKAQGEELRYYGNNEFIPVSSNDWDTHLDMLKRFINHNIARNGFDGMIENFTQEEIDLIQELNEK